MMNQLILKLLTLLSSFFIMNFVYKTFFYNKDLIKHSEVWSRFKDTLNTNPELLYLGESSNTTYKNSDWDQRSIAELSSIFLNNIKATHFTKEASHAGIYFDLLNSVPSSSSLKTVIVTLNLRSFNSGWINSDLETALRKSIILGKPYPALWNRFLLAFKAYPHPLNELRENKITQANKIPLDIYGDGTVMTSIDDWNAQMAKHGILESDGTKNEAQTTLACHYIKTYAFKIDTNTNPRIKDVDKIVRLCKKRNWNLILNLMAENIEMADSLVGAPLVHIIRENGELLMERYHKENAIVVNNLELVPDKEFIDRDWTTEHYSQQGRYLIAENLAKKGIQHFYPSQFIDSPKIIIPAPKSIFYTDMESQGDFDFNKSLSKEHFFSANHSSCINNKNEFSVTFVKPKKLLPDNAKNLLISYAMFQVDTIHDAKLVIEILGDRIPFLWNGIKLSDLNPATNQWLDLKYNYILPPTYDSSDVVKVYFFNKFESTVCIDNFKVEFQ